MRYRKELLIGLVLVTLALMAMDLLVGDTHIEAKTVWQALVNYTPNESAHRIVREIRTVRLIVAVLIGVALSLGGVMMQTLFRNPLADPYILGVTSGTSLGVAFFVLGIPLLGLQRAWWVQQIGMVGAGWLGAALIFVLMILISRRMRDAFGILIVGVMLSYIVSAVIQIMQYTSHAERLKLFTLWGLGTLSNVTSDQLAVMCVGVTLGLLLAVVSIKSLNAFLLGDDYAQTMGIAVPRARQRIIVSTIVLTATVTTYCGPVGFIGLAIPHVARSLFATSNHRLLLPSTAVLGAACMVLCDIVSKVFVLPINSITALIGIPIILRVIIKKLRAS